MRIFSLSFTGIGFGQFEDDPTDDFPPESSSRLPAFPDDYQLDPSITDQKPQTSLTFDQSTFPSFTSRIKVITIMMKPVAHDLPAPNAGLVLKWSLHVGHGYRVNKNKLIHS